MSGCRMITQDNENAFGENLGENAQLSIKFSHGQYVYIVCNVRSEGAETLTALGLRTVFRRTALSKATQRNLLNLWHVAGLVLAGPESFRFRGQVRPGRNVDHLTNFVACRRADTQPCRRLHGRPGSRTRASYQWFPPSPASRHKPHTLA